MKAKDVIERFNKIEQDFGMDCASVITTEALDSAVDCLLPIVDHIASDENDSGIHNDDHRDFYRSRKNPYTVVAGYCIHFLRKCLQYLKDRDQSAKTLAVNNELLIRDLGFAYTTYWHLHDGYILGYGMDNEVACFEYETFFLYDEGLSFASAGEVDHQAIQIISEIANLYRDYYCTPWPPKHDRPAPLRKNKPDFKPWLVAKYTGGQWRLPNEPASDFFLANNNLCQLIDGANLRIELNYQNLFIQTNADMGVEVAGGQVTVTFKNKVIDLASQSFSLVADINADGLAVDYWAPNRRKWLLDLYDEQLRPRRFAQYSVDQLDKILLAAQENILRFWVFNHPSQTPAITDQCCIRQLHRIKKNAAQLFFTEKFHSRLPERFKTKAVCIAYLELAPGLDDRFIPLELKMEHEVVHAIIKRMPRLEATDQQQNYADHVWNRLPQAVQCEAQAKFLIEKSGAQAYGWLPSSLRTESIRRFTVENAPGCLDDLAPVFTNGNERDNFLERTWPGIMGEIQRIECIDANIKRSEAFRLSMDCCQVNTLDELQLPIFE